MTKRLSHEDKVHIAEMVGFKVAEMYLEDRTPSKSALHSEMKKTISRRRPDCIDKDGDLLLSGTQYAELVEQAVKQANVQIRLKKARS